MNDAVDLVSGDTNLMGDIFVYDRKLDNIEIISVNTTGEQANARSSMPAISGNGRFISFLPATPIT